MSPPMTGPMKTGTPDGQAGGSRPGTGTAGVQLRDKDEDRGERDEWRSDTWWAMLAGKLLHPAQVASIEAFSYIGLPLCIADLAEIVDDIEAVHLDYHLGRLLKIGALELADARYAQKEFMEMRYRLSEERILSGGR